MWQCKEMLFNTKLSDCEEFIGERYNTNPWAMSLYCEAGLMKYAFGKKESDWEAGVHRCKAAAAQAGVLLKRHKTKAKKNTTDKAVLYMEALAMDANALLGVGLLHFMKKNMIKAAYYVRKSWKQWEAAENLMKDLKSLQAELPRRLEGYLAFGVGFFYWFVSMVPSHLMIFIKVLGFSGDRGRALELLNVAKDIPESGRSAEATMIIYFLFYWFMDERKAAPALLEGLQKQLPNSPLMSLCSGWTYLVNEHNTEKALERYEYAESLTDLEFLKVACKSQRAYAYFLSENWEKVVELQTSFLEKNPEADNRSYNAYSIAIAEYMQGHKEECTKWMKSSVEWEDKTSSWDNYSMTVAKAYLQANDFDRCTLLFVLAENSNEAGKGERAMSYLDEIEKLTEWKGFSADDKAAMHAYYKGCAFRVLKELDKAKSSLIKAAGMHNKTLSYEARRAVPYSLVVIGELYLRDWDSLDNAERYFAKAKQFKEKYLFAEMLGYRLKGNEEVLSHKRKKLKETEKK